MTQAVTSANTVPASVLKATLKSNKNNKEVALVNGFVQLYYYESILQDCIKVDYIFGDTGNAVDGKSVREGLPLVGTEDFTLAFEDNNGVKLEFDPGKNNPLIVNKVTPLDADSGKTVVTLSLVTEEFIRNEEGNASIRVRMDGKISDHVSEILTDFLKTEKALDIEDTSNNYNFVGNNRKPYYILNWLSKFGVPSGAEESDATAGFFFFETSEGFKFKSIDGLFGQEAKKKFVFNATADTGGVVPPGYDGKILSQNSDNRINYQDKLRMGAYGTKLVIFNPFDCKWEEIKQKAEDTKEKTTLAAKDLPTFNKRFDDPNLEDNYTRTTFMYVDTGTLPKGDTEEQIKENEKPNFEAFKVLNQGIRRYNQMFSAMQTITIAGDFSLHAGDAIFVDTPAIQAEIGDEVDRESGGLYIIADLCHYVSSKETYTKMNLVRDSFGRKPM